MNPVVEGVVANWRQWPKTLQLSAGAAGGAMTLALLYALVAGTPKPVSPSSELFEPVTLEQTLSSSRPELSSFDFIFRPVFALNRRPPEQPDLPSEDEAALAAEEAEPVVVESIDGVNLLGIFGSGEVAGMIVRRDNGARQRVVVGESIKGWTLDSIGSRHALLQAATGEEARLEMAYATDQSPLAAAGGGLNAADPQSAADADAGAVSKNNGEPRQKAAPDAVPESITFENIYGGAPKRDAMPGQQGNE